MRTLISLLLPVLLLCGCYGASVPNGNIVARAEDEQSGLKKTISVGEYTFSCQYKPAAYIVAKEHLTDEPTKQKRLKQFDSTVWFNVGISVKGADVNPLKYNAASQDEYNQRLSFFMMDAQAHFTLQYNGAELTPIAYHFENNYGLTPMDMIVVGFKIPERQPDHDMVLTYSDELYKAGILKFGIKAQNIQSIQ